MRRERGGKDLVSIAQQGEMNNGRKTVCTTALRAFAREAFVLQRRHDVLMQAGNEAAAAAAAAGDV